MALIHLYRRELLEARLPPVCMRCGAPAIVTRNHSFAWHPKWVDFLLLGLLGFFLCGALSLVFVLVWAIVALATTIRMRVSVPLCRAHRNHWAWRMGYVYIGTSLFAIVGTAALVFVIVKAQQESAADLIGFLCILPAGIGIAWLISAAIIQNGTIKATEITDRRITLCRVSPAFIDAIEASDAQEEAEFRWEKRSHTKADDRFYDPQAKRKPRPHPSEGFREDRH